MADNRTHSQGTQPPPVDRGHPMPRRTAPDQSVTLRHHRLARDASRKVSPGLASAQVPTSSPRRNSSGESHQTSNSDPKRWFDRSNRNPAATFDAGSMDVDPPFYQKETDSSNEEQRDPAAPHRNPAFPYAPGARPPLRQTVTHSSSADDYRSVIDDLTIENKRLKEELKRYKQFGPDMMRKEKLFEIKVHGLPKQKKRELEATLRDFAASLEGYSDSPSQRRKPARHGKNVYSSADGLSKHASSSSSHSRPVDSAYASMSTGPSSNAPNSSGTSLERPSISSRAKSSAEQKVAEYLRDTPDGLLPRQMVMTDKERKKLVVRRLEQLFTGKISGRNMHRNQSMPSMEPPASSELMAPPRSEASREAQIQPHDHGRKKTRSRDNVSMSNSNGDQTESGANGMGTGDGSGSGGRSGNNNTSPPTASLPEQRPTRPLDLDPDRVQIPSENLEYIRHLGLVRPEFLVGKKTSYQDVSPDADGWVYLNLLCNLAQLHMINVTPSFIRSAVVEKSTKFQLSPDGQKIRWRGGTDGTKFSSDSSGDNSQKSPSTDDTDGSHESGQRKKQKTHASGGVVTSGASSKESKFGPQVSASSDSFHYKPLFVRQSSSIETSSGSQASDGFVEESNMGHSKWDYSGSGSSQRKKRRHDGAMVFYQGTNWCIDLSGDPGDMSPTTYMTSTGQQDLDSVNSVPRLQVFRTLSGSSLPFRPLSDDRAIVPAALDMDLDNPPDLVQDDEDSPDDEDLEFPWCDDPEELQLRPIEPPLDPCGLGGVLPEDHFAVIVTTRRTIGHEKAERVARAYRSRSEETADAIASRLASMSTSSPMPPKSVASGDMPIEIEYLTGKIRRLKPVPLPPPAIFIPPFSTDSDTESDEDELISEDQDASDDELISEGLISQRANPHNSDNTYPDNEELSSNDEEDEVDENDDSLSEEHAFKCERTSRTIPQGIATAGTTSVPVAVAQQEQFRTESSVATAGDAESGYSSSIEDD
jgi:hypothetical protein